MRLRFQWAFLALFFLLSSCRVSREAAVQSVDFTILQINDVYEISPLEGGKSGGLARVATVKKELLRENPNTIAVLAGDFLSPFVYRHAQVGQRRTYCRPANGGNPQRDGLGLCHFRQPRV
jgi:2',3'-cyclic-nucleotide 2'-phosphodiesterase (5'-nucleotidase family)